MGKNSSDSGHRTAVSAQDFKYEYAKSSTRSQGFPVPASGRFSESTTFIRFTCSVSRHCHRRSPHRTLPVTVSYNRTELLALFAASIVTRSQGFSVPASGRFSENATFICFTCSMSRHCHRRSPHRTLPITVSYNRTELLALFAARFVTTFGRRIDFCIDTTDNGIPTRWSPCPLQPKCS